MLKKLFAPVILALVAALASSSVGYAASSSSIYHFKGSIFSVDTSTRTFRMSASGGRRTIHVDANTTYRGIANSLADLTQSMVVNVRAKLLPNGEYLALSVNALRIEVTATVEGQVTAVKGLTFTILGTDGTAYTFQVKAKTSFSGHSVKSVSGLRPGMQVRVTYTDTSSGKQRALKVAVISTK